MFSSVALAIIHVNYSFPIIITVAIISEDSDHTVVKMLANN